MGFFDLVGALAGLFVIFAFYAKNPKRLRIFAILSNLLFIFYAVAVWLWPVLVLHLVLLPLNLWRFREEVRAGAGEPAKKRERGQGGEPSLAR